MLQKYDYYLRNKNQRIFLKIFGRKIKRYYFCRQNNMILISGNSNILLLVNVVVLILKR